MQNKLKPCPFCGGMAMEVEKFSRLTDSFLTEISATIQCVYCGANIKKKWYEKNLQTNECFLNNETVYDLWNRRSDNA